MMLEGKVAVVTGSGRGIGRAVAKGLAQAGAKVVVNDYGVEVDGTQPSEGPAFEVVEEIKKAGGAAVANTDSVGTMNGGERIIRTALDTFGKLDVVVCVAGILRERMIFNMTEDEWDGVINTHLKGCFTVTKFASIYWRQERERGGRIMYFTSTAGINGGAGQPNYSAAHAAKIGLSLSNAQALARYGVTSNVISPGASTRMTDRGLAVERDAPPPSLSAAGTARDPMNAVPAIVYLASDAGKEITGRAIGVTGHKITVWKEQAWERTIYSEDPFWDIDTLFEIMPQTLAGGKLGMAPKLSP